MQVWRRQKAGQRRGSVLALVVIIMVLLTMAGMAMLKVAEGRLQQAVRLQSQESAFSAAEAAYEKAIFWMSQQIDMQDALGGSGSSGALNFTESHADYSIHFSTFMGARPIYRVVANGYAGVYQKTISAYMVQAVSGWELGMCRSPSGPNSTIALSFVDGEIIDFPMHINDLHDSPDGRDIYISGSPDFLAHVSMGESRYTPGGSDKYKSVMNLFPEGVSFNQPSSRIVNPASVSTKVDRFRDTTHPSYRFTPRIVRSIPKDKNGKNGFYNTVSETPAVQLKFYVKNGHGYVRIYNDCTAAVYTRAGSSDNTYDYCINTDSGSAYMKYPIYGCHYSTGAYTDVRIDDPTSSLYVRQDFGGVKSDPGAQIYVDGNVIIGCSQEDAATLGTLNAVKGQLAVVASGNIWMTNSLTVDGTRQADGMPAMDNPNIIGLISQGVIKVADPGMTTNDLLYQTSKFDATDVSGYMPIGLKDGTKTYDRALPATVTVEAAMTVGGGGWGAENIDRSWSYPGRENFNGSRNDNLVIRGSLTEVMRGIVGSGGNGYLKNYYYDRRVMTGILPGNVWLKGKYLLIPGGWVETSTIRKD